MGTGHKKGPGCGGTSLNFKVVGNPQPESPKGNTIWLNTDVDITGWYFAAEQPENMAEGEVWISTGTSSQVAFNALKKGTVMVYPISAKQMVGGALVDVTAKSYQGGEWVDWWNGELYDSGNEYEGATGGFIAVEMAYSSGFPKTAEPVLERGSNYLKATQNDLNSGCAVICANKMDLSTFSKLNYIGELKNTAVAGSTSLCIWSELGTYYNDNLVAQLPGVISGSVVDGSLKIGGLPSGQYYIGFFLYHTGSYIEITKMWLE